MAVLSGRPFGTCCWDNQLLYLEDFRPLACECDVVRCACGDGKGVILVVLLVLHTLFDDAELSTTAQDVEVVVVRVFLRQVSGHAVDLPDDRRPAVGESEKLRHLDHAHAIQDWPRVPFHCEKLSLQTVHHLG